ncbi:MAG: polyprenyl synthetase family protein, partial [Oscillibacter sp.]|nr:polyprenyl synthetase family protein [Oscillibacter sp.]
ETMAILAADALMIDAFALPLSATGLGYRERADCALILSRAAGSDGMVGGQVLDTVYNTTTEKQLTLTHRMKTGAMLAASCMMGAAAAGGALKDPAEEYGYQLGMAFQIRDDVLDVTASTEELGKPAGSDKEEGKVTFVDLLGVEGCERRVRECTDAALAVVREIDRDGFLRAMAETLVRRKK